MSMPALPPLETARLVLVPARADAARALLAGVDPGFPLGKGYPHEDSVHALHRIDGLGGWFITLKDDGRAIGDCGAKGWVDERGRVEIGYGLAAPWRGQGFGTEAVAALAEWLEVQPDVRAIIAEVEIGNEASRRLLQRAGFSLTGHEGVSWWFTRAIASSTGGQAGERGSISS